MADKEIPEERNINTNGGNYNENIEGDYIQGNKIILPENQLTPQEYRNRQALLTKVNNFWVKGVLEKSLHNQVLIELGLEERPDAIINSWNAILETGESSPQPLPQGTKIIDVFDEIGVGRTLLILGEPGSGKTTTLLELTRDLIALAEQDTKQLIPVVFNLSSWAKKRQKIEYWLTEELGNKYDVPKKIRESLVKEQQLLPLLDGLDEVKADYRDDCLVAINQFKQDYGSELVVCSRIKDYQDLSNRLNFQSAVYIKLLSSEQISNYLNNLEEKEKKAKSVAHLTGLRELIAKDEVWQELAQYPLMLNIMALAYQGVAIEDLPKTGALEERRKKLFDAYIEQVFQRRKANQHYTQRQVIYWLVWLAQRMVQESQTFFLIEKIQPNWLGNQNQKKIYIMVLSLLLGTISWLCLGLTLKLTFSLRLELSLAIFLVLSFALITLLNFRKKEGLQEIEIPQFDWKETLTSILNVVFVTGLIGLTIGKITANLIEGLLGGLIAGLSLGINIYLINRNLEKSKVKVTTSPNQGIWELLHYFTTVFILVGFGVGIGSGSIQKPIVGLSDGLSFGLMSGVLSGGVACIQHFSLRLILHYNNYIPCNYAHFLDYAADRILLQKVGGGYIFIHRMLMEHFAEMPLD